MRLRGGGWAECGHGKLLAAQPELVTPVLQVVQRVVTRHLLGQAGLKADESHGGAVTLTPRSGSAANLNVHLHCLVLDGVYRGGGEGVPAFVEVAAPAADAGADGAPTLRRLQAAAVASRIASGPRAGQKVQTIRGAMPREGTAGQPLAVARRHHAPGPEPAGVHAAACRAGAQAAVAQAGLRHRHAALPELRRR